MGSAIRMLSLSACALFLAPPAQAQDITGVDVVLHFAAPVDDVLKKAALSILRDMDEQARLHVAEDRQQAKFTASVEHDLLVLAEALQGAGIPFVGFSVMWPGSPSFLSLGTTSNGSVLVSTSSGPTAEQVAATKDAWIEAFPETYERICKGPVQAPAVK